MLHLWYVPVFYIIVYSSRILLQILVIIYNFLLPVTYLEYFLLDCFQWSSVYNLVMYVQWSTSVRVFLQIAIYIIKQSNGHLVHVYFYINQMYLSQFRPNSGNLQTIFAFWLNRILSWTIGKYGDNLHWSDYSNDPDMAKECGYAKHCCYHRELPVHHHSRQQIDSATDFTYSFIYQITVNIDHWFLLKAI